MKQLKSSTMYNNNDNNNKESNPMSTISVELLVEMLAWKRPDNSEENLDFCDKYLEPIFGLPDVWGNYSYTVENYNGTLPDIIFTAHHDTVHHKGGMQEVEVSDSGIAMLPDGSLSNCLGADCTTGIWIIIGMIEAGIPGTYVIHSAEEVGCVGSEKYVEDNAGWLNSDIKYCISFDRFGYTSIITHQCGARTSSNAFAKSLSSILGMPTLQPDSGGLFTDSNEYREVVPECTNLSVGYFDQHSSREVQDLIFVQALLQNLIDADWSKLVCERDPTDLDYGWGAYGGGSGGNYSMSNYYEDEDSTDEDVQDVVELIYNYPNSVAEVLVDYGVTADILKDELDKIDQYQRAVG